MKKNIWKKKLAVIMALSLVSGANISGRIFIPVTVKAADEAYAGSVDSNGYVRENNETSEEGNLTTEDGLTYRIYLEESYAEITGYNGNGKNLIIPESLDGVVMATEYLPIIIRYRIRQEERRLVSTM